MSQRLVARNETSRQVILTNRNLDFAEYDLRNQASQTAALEQTFPLSGEELDRSFERRTSKADASGQTDLCSGTPGSPVQCPVCLDEIRIVPPAGGRDDRGEMKEVATMR